MSMYTIHDLASDRTKEYPFYIERDFAVAQAHAADTGRTDILMGMFHAGSDWRREFQITEGARTLSCGDWCALKVSAPTPRQVIKLTGHILPQKAGVCLRCVQASDCPMPIMLEGHRSNLLCYGKDYKTTRPDIWEEGSIDEPEYDKDGTINWCPMQQVEK